MFFKQVQKNLRVKVCSHISSTRAYFKSYWPQNPFRSSGAFNPAVRKIWPKSLVNLFDKKTILSGISIEVILFYKILCKMWNKYLQYALKNSLV